MAAVGYVVIEYNQASGQPSIAFEAPYMFDDVNDAEVKAVELTQLTQSVGRRERYAIGTIHIEEQD